MTPDRIARIDQTTGFGDRIALEIAANAEIARAVRTRYPLSVAVILLADADDVTPRDQSISLAMRASVRATDQLFRYSEDTLVGLFPMAKGMGAAYVMKRAARLTDRPFAYALAVAPTDGTDIDTLVDQAYRSVIRFSL